jgi:hypothetical protein
MQHVGLYGSTETEIKDFVVKPKGRKPFGTRKCKWEDNIKVDNVGIIYEGSDWIQVM